MAKKIYFYLLNLIVLGLVITIIIGLFQISLTVSAQELESLEPINMTLAHADPPDPTKHCHAASLAFKEYVESESGGKIQVRISPGGELGYQEILQEMTMTGEIEASTSHTEGTIAIVYPNIQCISIPYLFESIDHALDVFRGEFGKALYEDMRQKTGIRVIGIWDSGGFAVFTNNKREVRIPEDMKGLRIRTMEIPAHLELVKALGASPIPISWGELYTSLQTGVVDGQMNSIPVIMVGSIYEVQKYMTLTNHLLFLQHFFVNDNWFQSLPEPYKRIIIRGGEIAALTGEKTNRVTRDIGMRYFNRYLDIYEPTSEERALFKDKTQEVLIKFCRDIIDDSSWVDKLLEATQKSRERLGYTVLD